MEKMEIWTCRLVREQSAVPMPEGGHKVNGPAGVARVMEALHGASPVEHFVAFVLNARHEITAIVPITTGILDASIVHPREVFRAAILGNAAAIIIAHNHPSGDVTPSAEERQVTRLLKEAGEVLGIPCLDHVVVGRDGKFFAFSSEEVA